MVKDGIDVDDFIVSGEKITIVLNETLDNAKTAYGYHKFSYDEFIEKFVSRK